MILTRPSTLPEVAGVVAGALRKAHILAVLTGGACATLYSGGAYESRDLDFIVRGPATRAALDLAMASIGFARDGDRYIHPATPFFVEFPRGPLAIGEDFDIEPVSLKIGRDRTLALSATDSCRDRLAAFYHWNDRQSLEVAVLVGTRRRIALGTIRKWSVAEGHLEQFEEFLRELRRARAAGTAPAPPRRETRARRARRGRRPR